MAEKSDKKLTKKKGNRVINWKVGVCALAIVAGATYFYDKETGMISDWLDDAFENKKPNDSIAAIADKLPVDNKGIIDITLPIIDRTLEEPNGRYSSFDGYDTYGIYTEDGKVELKRYSNATNNTAGGSVVDYQSVDGVKPTGVISIVDDYSEFLNYMEGVLDSIAKGETTYTSKLKKIDYEVDDLYSLKDGYDLYTDDVSIRSQAELAYIDTDKTKVYMIPAQYVGKFVGVQSEICEYILKYEGLREQIIFAYNTYNENARQFIGTIDEETENRSR